MLHHRSHARTNPPAGRTPPEPIHRGHQGSCERRLLVVAGLGWSVAGGSKGRGLRKWPFLAGGMGVLCHQQHQTAAPRQSRARTSILVHAAVDCGAGDARRRWRKTPITHGKGAGSLASQEEQQKRRIQAHRRLLTGAGRRRRLRRRLRTFRTPTANEMQSTSIAITGAKQNKLANPSQINSSLACWFAFGSSSSPQFHLSPHASRA